MPDGSTPQDQAAAAFREVVEPLHAPLEDWQVTDAQADLAGRRLAALDQPTFDAVVGRMASVEGGKYLRRLVTETEEEATDVPEAIRAFVARLAARGSTAAMRTALLSLRRHALGRFLAALGKASREAARRLVLAAGGPDAIGALAIEEALRAIVEHNPRATRSLAAGLAALLGAMPPQSAPIRAVAAHLAHRTHEWPARPCETLLRALERGAALDHALPGYVPDAHGLPHPFGDDAFLASLYEDLLARRPRGSPLPPGYGSGHV
jgi:hypothetical protein